MDQLKIQTTNFVHRKSLLNLNFFNIFVMFEYTINFNKYMHNLNIKH